MFSLICAWLNGWINKREAGDLRRHRAHYDVIVMGICLSIPVWISDDFVYLRICASQSVNNFISKHSAINAMRYMHYSDVIMGAIASQIASHTIVYSTVYSDADQRKHQSSASLAFVRGIHRSPVNSPHKGPVARKTFPFDDVIMEEYEFDFHLDLKLFFKLYMCLF